VLPISLQVLEVERAAAAVAAAGVPVAEVPWVLDRLKTITRTICQAQRWMNAGPRKQGKNQSQVFRSIFKGWLNALFTTSRMRRPFFSLSVELYIKNCLGPEDMISTDPFYCKECRFSVDELYVGPMMK
jgi:hypothetical protein